jgi:glycosyltransferase involved in cell wall biosynthesis
MSGKMNQTGKLREVEMGDESVATTRRSCSRDESWLDEPPNVICDRTRSPTVSIIVVSYNYASYVAEAVESALGQTYPKTEVVVVDDGSTDSSRDILRAFGGRIRLVLKDRGGETSAVNAGFAASCGDIVMFLDSDDVLASVAAEAVVAAWRFAAAKIQFSLVEIDASGRERGRGIPVYPRGFSAKDVNAMTRTIGFYPTPPTSGNAYGRAFLEQILPLDTQLYPFAPDGLLNVVAPLYGDVVTLDRILGCYRVHDRNIWASPTLNPERILSWISLGRKEAAFLRAHAQAQGVQIAADDPLDHSWVYLQRRLAARKLIPKHPLVSEDEPLSLFLLACRALLREEPHTMLRTLKAAWFLTTALAPHRQARRLLEWVLAPASRPHLMSSVLREIRRRRSRA